MSPDIRTNFPEVPANQHWKVTFGTTKVSRSSYYRDPVFLTVPGVTVRLIEVKTVGKLWKRELSNTVKASSTPLSSNSIRSLPGLNKYGLGYYRINDVEVLAERHYPEVILALALEVLSELDREAQLNQTKQAIQNAQDSLAGDYPPKRLELG